MTIIPMRNAVFIMTVTLAGLLAACGRGEAPATAVAPAPSLFDPSRLTHGAQLFEEKCAQCHGPQGQGHPDWQSPQSDKFAAAPPLNGTGRDWQRTRAELTKTIREGVRAKDGAQIMPAWQGRLEPRDIEDVMMFFQSLWPGELYTDWLKANPPPAG